MDEIQRYHWTTSGMRAGRDPDYAEDWVRSCDHLADKKAALEAQAVEHAEKIVRQESFRIRELNRLEIIHTGALEVQARRHGIDLLQQRVRLDSSHMEVLRRLKSQHAAELKTINELHLGEIAILEAQIGGARGEGGPALIHFKRPHLIGEPCMIHQDFWQTMDRLCTIAHDCEVKLYVTHSMRRLDQVLQDTVVKQALRSNHHAGSAVDLNVVCDGEWFNSEKMRPDAINQLNPHHNVRRFIFKASCDQTLRWGGDFTKPDTVHFDDNLVLRDPDEWARRVDQLTEE